MVEWLVEHIESYGDKKFGAHEMEWDLREDVYARLKERHPDAVFLETSDYSCYLCLGREQLRALRESFIVERDFAELCIRKAGKKLKEIESAKPAAK